jgi:hypothetical protein
MLSVLKLGLRDLCSPICRSLLLGQSRVIAPLLFNPLLHPYIIMYNHIYIYMGVCIYAYIHTYIHSCVHKFNYTCECVCEREWEIVCMQTSRKYKHLKALHACIDAHTNRQRHKNIGACFRVIA